MTAFSRRLHMQRLGWVLLTSITGMAAAQVGGQVAPLLANPPFKAAASGPLGTYLLPGGVSVALVQKGGFLGSATVQVNYDPQLGAEANKANVAHAASVMGLLSGFGEGMAHPLTNFLLRAEVGPQLPRGFDLRADPFSIGVRLEGKVLKMTLSRPQVPEGAFSSTGNALPPRDSGMKNPVVIRIFSDFQCPYCQKFETETLPTLLAKLPKDVRLEFHHFPLEQIHPLARPSAEASECAAQQGKFWAYKDALFTDRSWLSSNPQEVFLRLANKLKLNSSDFQKCLTTRAGKQAVDAGLAEAMRLGVEGTPTIYVNGMRPASVYDATELLQLIDFARVVGPGPATPAPKTP